MLAATATDKRSGAQSLRCTRAGSLMHDLWEVVNEANVREGMDFMREAEGTVEKQALCQTPTSSCVMSKFRDSHVDVSLLGRTIKKCSVGLAEAREASCEDLQKLRERIQGVVHQYESERDLIEQIRASALRLLERRECKVPAAYSRKLSSSLPDCTIPSEGYYILNASCRLTAEITVGSNMTLTIVGVGAPTIDREENGRHFNVTGGGHLNVTGVTFANGKVVADYVSWVL